MLLRLVLLLVLLLILSVLCEFVFDDEMNGMFVGVIDVEELLVLVLRLRLRLRVRFLLIL